MPFANAAAGFVKNEAKVIILMSDCRRGFVHVYGDGGLRRRTRANLLLAGRIDPQATSCPAAAQGVGAASVKWTLRKISPGGRVPICRGISVVSPGRVTNGGNDAAWMNFSVAQQLVTAVQIGKIAKIALAADGQYDRAG